jgi:lambda repressor-like predicted transcriptional regulator
VAGRGVEEPTLNDALRRAIFQARLSEADVAAHLSVDPKTVRRWLDGRLPYPRHRWDLAEFLKVDPMELWPELRALHAARSRPAEITAIYPRRSAVANDGWRELFESATHEIDILAYSSLFLAENSEVLRVLAAKANAGAMVRIALGDPDSPHVAERGNEEEIGEAMAAKIRNALVLYRPLCAINGVQLRLHGTTRGSAKSCFSRSSVV